MPELYKKINGQMVKVADAEDFPIPVGGVSVLTEKTITQNGTYLAESDNSDGYSKVVVNTPSVTEPYIKETYNSNDALISARMVGHTSVRSSMFRDCNNLALIELPSGITIIGDYAFYSDGYLALTELPSGLTRINQYAFGYCTNLALTELPSGLTTIATYAFRDCKRITTLTFNSKPTTISSNSFYGCTNLLDIYVPWSEGEVANAPWGATNATIHFSWTPTT